MFEEYEDDEENDEAERGIHMHNSLEALRDHVLMVFGGFISTLSGQDVTNAIDHQRQFLEMWEVESIVKERCDIAQDGVYGIGANTFEEYKEKMLGLFRALGSRILSNIMSTGVKEGLLDAEYDFEKDAFAFSVTEKGMQIVDKQPDNDINAGKP